MKKTNCMLCFFISVILIGMTNCSNLNSNSLSENQKKLDNYNVIWNSPSKDHHGSVPLGNGDIGLNVWVEESGDICFYIGKTDSWGDNGRLLKVGKVRVKSDPSIVFTDMKFNQELDLKTGSIKISSHGKIDNKEFDFNLQIWVDANNPVIHLTHDCSVPMAMTANIELWRTEPYSLPSLEVSDLLEDRSKPGNLPEPVIVEPDNLISGKEKYVGWFHHNKKSVGFDFNMKLQGLSDYPIIDPILHRTFGAIITATDAEKLNDTSIKSKTSKSGSFNIYVLTQHPSLPNEWQEQVELIAADIEAKSFNDRKKDHENWWSDFWDRSWIYADASDSNSTQAEEAYAVTRAYTLQRFIDALAGRGNFPIKFNGSLFTVPAENKPGDADYRRWGPGYWWQNTRLPYLSMCATGDFEMLQPLFKMYADEIYSLSKYRTKKYFGFDGVYIPEVMYFWGSVFTGDYGWTPYEKREDPLQESRWHKWEWVAGPELVFMMLDYYDYIQDEEFLKQRIIPFANSVITFFDSFYQTNEKGKIVMYPSQAVETWWDCTNPMPEVSGLHGIIKRLVALPESLTNEFDRLFWNKIHTKLPEIPLRETSSGMALAPAERFEDLRNVESPELYAVFPFRLYGVGNPNLEYGINALEHQFNKQGASGWSQDDLFMTYLGLKEQAKTNLVKRALNFDKNSRFPAFWGPNYDWIPDQDHGGVLMKTFQSMLIQADPYSKKIYLTPAWPKEWNADFKLHAPYNTIIEGVVKDGKIESLKITPSYRKDDVIIL